MFGKMRRSVPPRSFTTGFDTEEQLLTWKIKGFPWIRKERSLIDSQSIDFDAGATIGHSSQWTVFLTEEMKEEKRWIGIYFKMKTPTPSDPAFKNAYAEMVFAIQRKNGKMKSSRNERKHIPSTFTGRAGWGLMRFIDADDSNLHPEETLVIELHFKLHALSTSVKIEPAASLQFTMEKFQAKSSAKAWKDLAFLLKNPLSCTIKIISKDKKEFTMQWGVLAARSEVFAAMLRSNMTEANFGVLELPDLSSEVIKVLINFFYTGELLPTWSQTEVVVELTYAAGKYELQDLLQFLNVTLGKVCQLQNVGALATLARQLSLNAAEKELMLFVKNEGVNSLENFIKMWNAELSMQD